MTTTTTHTTTPTFTADSPVSGHRWGRWALAAGAVVAVAATGIIVASTNDPEPRQRPAAVASDLRRAAVLAEVAEMARENGLTGLSPLSLRPIERRTASETVAERGSITAIEHGVARRSPAETVARYGSISAIEHLDLERG